MLRRHLFICVLLFIFGFTGIAGATRICQHPICPPDSEFNVWTARKTFDNGNYLNPGESLSFEFDITPQYNAGDSIKAAWTVFHFVGGDRDWYKGLYSYEIDSASYTQREWFQTNSRGHAWEPERLRAGALESLRATGTLSGLLENITPEGWNCGNPGFSVKAAFLFAKGCDTNPVPEPATMLLLGSGLVAIAGFGRKKFVNKKKK